MGSNASSRSRRNSRRSQTNSSRSDGAMQQGGGQGQINRRKDEISGNMKRPVSIKMDPNRNPRTKGPSDSQAREGRGYENKKNKIRLSIFKRNDGGADFRIRHITKDANDLAATALAVLERDQNLVGVQSLNIIIPLQLQYDARKTLDQLGELQRMLNDKGVLSRITFQEKTNMAEVLAFLKEKGKHRDSRQAYRAIEGHVEQLATLEAQLQKDPVQNRPQIVQNMTNILNTITQLETQAMSQHWNRGLRNKRNVSLRNSIAVIGHLINVHRRANPASSQYAPVPAQQPTTNNEYAPAPAQQTANNDQYALAPVQQTTTNDQYAPAPAQNQQGQIYAPAPAQLPNAQGLQRSQNEYGRVPLAPNTYDVVLPVSQQPGAQIVPQTDSMYDRVVMPNQNYDRVTDVLDPQIYDQVTSPLSPQNYDEVRSPLTP